MIGNNRSIYKITCDWFQSYFYYRKTIRIGNGVGHFYKCESNHTQLACMKGLLSFCYFYSNFYNQPYLKRKINRCINITMSFVIYQRGEKKFVWGFPLRLGKKRRKTGTRIPFSQDKGGCCIKKYEGCHKEWIILAVPYCGKLLFIQIKTSFKGRKVRFLQKPCRAR